MREQIHRKQWNRINFSTMAPKASELRSIHLVEGKRSLMMNFRTRFASSNRDISWSSRDVSIAHILVS